MAAHRVFLTGLWARVEDVGKHAGRYTLAAGLAVSLAGITPAVRAQQTPPQGVAAPGAPAVAQPATPVTHRDMRAFNRYLNHNPKVARELRKDPSLASNPEFLAKHPRLQKYLAKHPAVASSLKENPQAFLKREKHHQHKTVPNKA